MLMVNNVTKTLLFLVLNLVVAFNVASHERFMVPSHTLLSVVDSKKVTLIASISNAIFHPDMPLGDSNTGADVGDLADLFKLLKHQVINPKGDVNQNVRWQAFSRLSVADVEIKDTGTYRISLVQPDVAMTTFKKADGTPWRLFGTKPSLPAGATDVVRRTTSSRVETFVTLNAPSKAAVNPTGQGLELAGETHPNDLFALEAAQFQLFFNGKPLTIPAKVKVIKAGTRHRNNRNEQALSIDDEGKFTFIAQQAGFYFLAAETKVEAIDEPNVDVKHFSLYLSLEVFPQ